MEGKERVEAAFVDFDTAIRYAKNAYRLQRNDHEKEMVVWVERSLKRVNGLLADALVKGEYLAFKNGSTGTEGVNLLELEEVLEAGSLAKEIPERSGQARFGEERAAFWKSVCKGLGELKVYPYVTPEYDRYARPIKTTEQPPMLVP